MSTRKAVRQLVTPLLGGEAGDIASGTATTIVSNDLLGSFKDDEYNGWELIMPDAANTADTNRQITDCVGTTGTFTWSGNRTDTTYTSETFELYPPDGFSLLSINNAINEVLKKSGPTRQLIIPLVAGIRSYSLARFTWVIDEADMPLVCVRNSPNLLSNSSFTVWGSGAAAAPTFWSLSGSGATIARTGATSALVGVDGYGAAITRVSNDAQLTHAVLSDALRRDLEGEQVTAGVWAYATVASRSEVRVTDGVDTTDGTAHTGNSSLQWLTSTHTVNAAQNTLEVGLRVEGGDTTVTYSNPVLVRGSSIPDYLRDYGEAQFPQRPLTMGHEYRVIGNQLHLDFEPSSDTQLVIYSNVPYPTISADSTSTDCPDDLLKWGTFAYLAAIARPSVDRTRWDPSYLRAATVFERILKTHRRVNLPAPKTQTFLVTGA